MINHCKSKNELSSKGDETVSISKDSVPILNYYYYFLN